MRRREHSRHGIEVAAPFCQAGGIICQRHRKYRRANNAVTAQARWHLIHQENSLSTLDDRNRL